MMRAVAQTTRESGVKTLVSMDPLMVDGTGMCGGCRVTVGGKTRFVCVDGPEFDAHQVDFRELADRLTTYRGFEQAALERQQQVHAAKMAARPSDLQEAPR
jgi:ferredoxin/flavodoxin---NADP+ reductase